ncbi:polysaccharide deacetylase family protein [Falsibacillus albus]|uniref:Polysaccharide deacetylase n=1 Tax=Falsibacillus albus TaxID=2478915 RepID=A0A3L7JX45_9BACI|nr:polysaccharide deacetylase family protein [Falsibacillus albus]RLQ95357.1 polysaccharide deacetylase [Falsibacillus albus]
MSKRRKQRKMKRFEKFMIMVPAALLTITCGYQILHTNEGKADAMSARNYYSPLILEDWKFDKTIEMKLPSWSYQYDIVLTPELKESMEFKKKKSESNKGDKQETTQTNSSNHTEKDETNTNLPESNPSSSKKQLESSDKKDDSNVVNKPVGDKKEKDQSENTDRQDNGSGNKTENQDDQKANHEKVVYLTFDDGPSAESEQFISLLNKYHAKATFFMLEPNMKKHPEALQDMKKNGEGMGLHGVTHQASLIYRSPQTVVDEMKEDEKALINLTGVDTHLIRTPYGSAPYMKPNYMKAVDEAGFVLWDWNIDSEDWKYPNGEFVQNTIHQVENFPYHQPKVVLMHEKSTTLAHLESILKYFQKEGYTMLPLNEEIKPVQFESY